MNSAVVAKPCVGFPIRRVSTAASISFTFQWASQGRRHYAEFQSVSGLAVQSARRCRPCRWSVSDVFPVFGYGTGDAIAIFQQTISIGVAGDSSAKEQLLARRAAPNRASGEGAALVFA